MWFRIFMWDILRPPPPLDQNLVSRIQAHPKKGWGNPPPFLRFGSPVTVETKLNGGYKLAVDAPNLYVFAGVRAGKDGIQHGERGVGRGSR